MLRYPPLSTTGRCKNFPSCMVWRASTIGVSTVAHSGLGVITWRIVLGRGKTNYIKILSNLSGQQKIDKITENGYYELYETKKQLHLDNSSDLAALAMDIDVKTNEEKEGRSLPSPLK